jgi:Fe-S cluster assembly protein SufD
LAGAHHLPSGRALPARCHEVRSLSSFHATPDALAALPGPGWLASRRAAAADRLGEPELPSTEEEVWRYSRIDELDLDAFTPALGPPAGSGAPAPVAAVLDQLGERSGAAVVHNGRLVHLELADDLAARGVHLGPAGDRDGHRELVGALTGEPVDTFVALNDVFAPEPLVLDVPAGVVVPHPVVVVDWLDVADAAIFSRVAIRLGEDAEVAVIDWHGSDDVVALAAPVTELVASRAARLRHVTVQDRGPRVWQMATQVSQVEADASITAAQVGLGGYYARTRADCRLTGRGATGRLRAVYFGEGAQMLDFRTFQDHVAPDTTSDLLFKGAVGDQSRSVYTGLIRVRKEARGTNAFQTNRNIKLSDGAWAESVPNLEIENNDVRCSHASTVGPVDEDQRFYLESRGVPTEVAERLIVSGFFDEVLDQIPGDGLGALVGHRIDERLDRRRSPLVDAPSGGSADA